MNKSRILRQDVSTEPLPLPPSKLPPEEQINALNRMQDQAEKRVKLGQQLFIAAEAQAQQYKKLVDEFRDENARLREELHQDLGKTIHTYDKWVGQVDSRFSQSLGDLEDRMSRLQADWERAQQRIEEMLSRSERLLDEGKRLIDEADADGQGHATPRVPSVASTKPAIATKAAPPVQAIVDESPLAPNIIGGIDENFAGPIIEGDFVAPSALGISDSALESLRPAMILPPMESTPDAPVVAPPITAALAPTPATEILAAAEKPAPTPVANATDEPSPVARRHKFFSRVLAKLDEIEKQKSAD